MYRRNEEEPREKGIGVVCGLQRQQRANGGWRERPELFFDERSWQKSDGARTFGLVGRGSRCPQPFGAVLESLRSIEQESS